MSVRFVLRLCGIDLRDIDELDRLGPELDAVHFEAVGELSLATVLADGVDPVRAALRAARLIEQSVEGVTIAGVYRERVGLSEIAERLGVGREAVRLWAAGSRRSKRSFPAPHDVSSVGGRMSYQYAWSEVLEWARCEDLAPAAPGAVREASTGQVAELELLLSREDEPAMTSSPVSYIWSQPSLRVEVCRAFAHKVRSAPGKESYETVRLSYPPESYGA